MRIGKNLNGKGLKIKTKYFVFKYWTNNVQGIEELRGFKMKNFLYQFNRFDNGYCGFYLRLFKKYSFNIDSIKLKEGKRVFWGNKENR